MSKNNKKVSIIFIGTPDFGVPTLEALIEKYNVKAVITQPDKKIGRKQILTPPPIKKIAEKYKIEVWQPEKIINIKDKIKKLNPDLAVVAAYAQIIPKEILDIPKHGFLNIHASLLPKYRGASCIQAAILDGEKETGITIMNMDEGLDTGPILAQESVKISAKDTAGSLFNKLSEIGASLLINTLDKYLKGAVNPKIQDSSKSSYAKILKKLDGKIDWKKNAEYIERFVRAMYPWPGAFSRLENKILKMAEIKEIVKINKHKPGELFIHNGELAVQCGKDALVIKKLQIEGKKEINTKDFLSGYTEKIGNILC